MGVQAPKKIKKVTITLEDGNVEIFRGEGHYSIVDTAAESDKPNGPRMNYVQLSIVIDQG